MKKVRLCEREISDPVGVTQWDFTFVVDIYISMIHYLLMELTQER